MLINANTGRRYAAVLLLAVFFTLIFSFFGTTAFAATDTITILMIDSSVIGADAKTASKGVEDTSVSSLMSQLKVWDAANLNTMDFLCTAEGLSRLDGRNLILYDLGPDADYKTNHKDHYKETFDTGGAVSSTYYKESCLADLPAANKTVLTKFTGTGTKTAKEYKVVHFGGLSDSRTSAIEIDISGLTPNNLYVIAEDMGTRKYNDSFYGYVPNIEQTTGNRGWQAAFVYQAGKSITVGLDSTTGIWSTTTAGAPDTGALRGGADSQPLHNEVQRAGFSFKVKDVETQDSVGQGYGDLTGAVFAVFNVSDTATEPVYPDTVSSQPYLQNKPTKTTMTERDTVVKQPWGYVTVNHAGTALGQPTDETARNEAIKKIDTDESVEFYPAYSVEDIIKNYETYLTDSVGATNSLSDHDVPVRRYTSGLYNKGMGANTLSKNNYDVIGNNKYGLFAMGTDSKKVPIVPCLILATGADGIVSTGDGALPVGNYLVLQIRSGEGYYIDENFRPIVSIGGFAEDLSNPNTGNGYGNAYFGMFSNSLGNTVSMANQAKWSVIDSKGLPVAYVETQNGITDLSSCNNFGVSDKGELGNYASLGIGGTYNSEAASYPSKNSYLINPGADINESATETSNAKAVGDRRKPKEGTSRFNAYNAIIRGGTDVYIGDADDVKLSPDVTAYEPSAQGDGSLDGAVFRLYNVAPSAAITRVTEKTSTGKVAYFGLGTEAVALPNGGTGFKEYTAGFDPTERKYMLRIPADELPYGVYKLTQVTTGKGYGHTTPEPAWEDSKTNWSENEVFLKYVYVIKENKVGAYMGYTVDGGKPTSDRQKEILNSYTKQGNLYMPQTIVTAPTLLSFSAGDEYAANSEATVEVYNISDNKVYAGIPKKAVSSAQSNYNSDLAGKSLTIPQIASKVAAWPADSKVASVTSKLLDMDSKLKSAVGDLPYGRYVVVITKLDSKLKLVGEPVFKGQVSAPDKGLTWSATASDKTLSPGISTVLLDTTYRIDSIPVSKNGSLTDTVTLTSLKENVDYTVYGVLINKSTGEMVQGVPVAYKSGIRGYVPYTGSPDDTLKTVLEPLIDEGQRYVSGSSFANPGYIAWLDRVAAYATTSDVVLNTFVSSVKSRLSEPGTVSTSTIADEHALIINQLLHKLTGEGDGLAGSAVVTLRYDNLNTVASEGTAYVSYVFLCEGNSLDGAISAQDIGSFRGAIATTLKGTHMDSNDEAQTAYVLSLGITAKGSVSGSKAVGLGEPVAVDVAYGNVYPGNTYRLTVTLKDDSGKTIAGGDADYTRDIVPRDAAGVEQFLFDKLDYAALNGKRVTAYADLHRIVKAADITTPYKLVTKGDGASLGWALGDVIPGVNQVDVRVPTVGTVLSALDGSKTVDFSADVKLVDKVSYDNLSEGAKYESVLTLTNKAGGVIKDAAGASVSSTVKFTASGTSQVIEIPITVTKDLDLGGSVTAFNDLYLVSTDSKIKVVSENTPALAAQTVTAAVPVVKPIMATSVSSVDTGTQYVPASASVPLVDTIRMSDLDPNKDYLLMTRIGDTRTGAVVAQFKTVETPVKSDEDGMISTSVTISVNTLPYAGRMLTVYQTLYDKAGKTVIVDHSDVSDLNQGVYIADIITELTSSPNGSKKVIPKVKEVENITVVQSSLNPLAQATQGATTQGTTTQSAPQTKVTKSYSYEATLTDVVTYSNLSVGSKYRATCKIMDAEGKTVIGQTYTTFTPTVSAGSVNVPITIDVTNYLGKDVVAFETITDEYNGTVVVVHDDASDKNQTVSILSTAEIAAATGAQPTASAEPSASASASPTGGSSSGGGLSLPGLSLPDGTNIKTGVDDAYTPYIYLGVMIALTAAIVWIIWFLRNRK